MHAKLIDLLNIKLENRDFINRHKFEETNFTRNRSFSFKSICLFLISTIQSSLQRELDRFFKAYNDKKVSERYVTQSAFSQARLKIKPEAFEELSGDCVNYFYSNYAYKVWNGFRLIAIDGSEVLLPKNKGTVDEFGEYTTNFMNGTVVLARLSKAYDVLNNISIPASPVGGDAKLVNTEIGEHPLAKEHLEHLGEGDLILYDRGYPSYDLFKKDIDKGCQFCARVAVANWSAAKKLVESGEKEIIAEITPGYEMKKQYKRQGIDFEPIKCRFICIELSTGEKEVLITSLLDVEEYPYELFDELYHLRWGVEESYKIDKHRLELENFSGKSVVAIKQDFFANILMGNLTAILSSNLGEKINKKKRKYDYQVNKTTALSKVKEFLAFLFNSLDVLQFIETLVSEFLLNVLPIRLGRSFQRKKQQRKRYHKTYLTL
ncbi:MAG: IS4 family transposase [Candidatus Scalindua sp.]